MPQVHIVVERSTFAFLVAAASPVTVQASLKICLFCCTTFAASNLLGFRSGMQFASDVQYLSSL